MNNEKMDIHLKRWMFALTFSAGFLNATAFLQYFNVITHHTGTLTQVGVKLINGEYESVILLFGVLLSYVAGATLSGILFPIEVFKPRKRYAGILIYSSIGLLIVLRGALSHSWLLWYLSFMSGTQNGMYVNYKGMILRTTHMTGALTDIGLAIGRWISEKEHHHLMRFKFQLFNVVAFLIGATMASVLSQVVHFNLLYVVIVFNILIGFDYLFFYKKFPKKV